MAQRPIILYQNLMKNYSRQVTELMMAKTSYILLATPTDDQVAPIDMVETKNLTDEPVVEVPTTPAVVETPSVGGHEQINLFDCDDEPDPTVDNSSASLGLDFDAILAEETILAEKNQSQYFPDENKN
ncbi:MAG: hypothetical protein LBT80_05965 [Lactobacillaceae bacterium]|jgi:hypothetical protein|nr:hypothetical protein [Lactobacillaceae bacterium]